MFKRLLNLCITASFLATGVAQGANVYVPGTHAHELVKSIDAYVPSNMVPVIVLESDRNAFDGHDSRAELSRHGLTAKRFNEIQARPWNTSIGGSDAYIKVIDLDKADNGPAVCFMHFKNAEVLATELMHEAMHCRTIYTAEWKQWATQAIKIIPASVIGSDGNVIPTGLKQYVIAEVHARVMAYLLMRETRTAGDSRFFINDLNADYPRNPGKNSIKRGVNLCTKEISCSNDASELMQALSQDELFKKAYITDLNAAYDQHLKLGGLDRFRR